MIKRVAAEALGTALLLISVIGSGIMGVALADGNDAIALLANAIATGCMLYVIITTLGPISGAHFNPAVSLAFAFRGYITGAYWFTSSTSFANPAVTVARGFSDTFAGINPSHIPAFILAQVAAVAVGHLVLTRLFGRD